ncbi:hypothetical protein RHGRI_034454 [Rhododendron griersonianum]|uniref:Uncharacterized protein n=1 Tax=Rhododendron griersonianum TaxID=479676 RepID=A0AAV6I3Y3_9ERIC|nr:hypothetical protein RHGRI_034454 [Rhododendron griersonianum]
MSPYTCTALPPVFTFVLEINLVTFPNVADAILANSMVSHYDCPRIAQLCEKAGLYVRALKHYSELQDIKRVIVNTHAIEPQSLVEFFGTLSKEWALECMKDLLLVNLRGNLQIIVQVAKEYSEQLGVDACIKLFEQFKSYEGLYFFLGSYLSSCEDPDIHFPRGQIKEVECVTRESNFYDTEKTKNFLMEAKLPDARPLINVCDCFGFVPDLTHYLYWNNMLRYIEGYIQKGNPGNAWLVVGQLLDDECPEDFIEGLILSVRSLVPVEPLECKMMALPFPIIFSDIIHPNNTTLSAPWSRSRNHLPLSSSSSSAHRRNPAFPVALTLSTVAPPSVHRHNPSPPHPKKNKRRAK